MPESGRQHVDGYGEGGILLIRFRSHERGDDRHLLRRLGERLGEERIVIWFVFFNGYGLKDVEDEYFRARVCGALDGIGVVRLPESGQFGESVQSFVVDADDDDVAGRCRPAKDEVRVAAL